jgi:hypothetical protein
LEVKRAAEKFPTTKYMFGMPLSREQPLGTYSPLEEYQRRCYVRPHVLELALVVEGPHRGHLVYPFVAQRHADGVREAGVACSEDYDVRFGGRPVFEQYSVPQKSRNFAILNFDFTGGDLGTRARVKVVPSGAIEGH